MWKDKTGIIDSIFTVVKSKPTIWSSGSVYSHLPILAVVSHSFVFNEDFGLQLFLFIKVNSEYIPITALPTLPNMTQYIWLMKTATDS